MSFSASDHNVKPTVIPFGTPASRLAKACSDCRQHKVACKPGSSGSYPCQRCEEVKWVILWLYVHVRMYTTDGRIQCVLVERQRPAPSASLGE